MMASVSTAELEIPIWVKGTQKWVTGLTKRTTCDDVIYALLYQEGLHETANTSAYAIFEKWKEVERPLQGRTKIIKVWRTWGAEQANVHLSMKRIDELEYSGEFSLTRRKKRSRHKTRDRERDRDRERERGRHAHHGGHHTCQNASDRLRSMEALVKLVISQERKLKDIFEQADDTDKLIERYESKQHTRRLQQNGEDYVQDSYLDSNSEDNMDDFFSNVNIEELELYVAYCDKIIALDDQITNEYSKIEDLSYQIQKCSNEQSPEGSKCADSMAKVQSDLNRAVSCAIMQQYKFQDLQRELQFYEEKLESKDMIQKRLQEELDELESLDLSYDNGDSANSSRSSIHGSRDSLKGSKNPPPLPERPPRAPLVDQSNPLPVPERRVINPLPVPERKRHKPEVATSERKIEQRNGIVIPHTGNNGVIERKPILKPSSDLRNGYVEQNKSGSNSETKVRFSTDTIVDKYYWEESSSEGISIDQSDCSDSKDLFECPVSRRGDSYSSIKSGVADKPYLTVKVEDNDSNSDTGLSSMHSDDSAVYHLETLV